MSDPAISTPEADQVEVVDTITLENDLRDLPDGRVLGADGATLILRSSGANVILFGGAVHSGKTSLVASIYERLQRSHFGEYHFAGSETLVAFEERCHLSRIESGNSESSMPRTEAKDGWQFFHLSLRQLDTKAPAQHLLFCDLSGELFERSVGSLDEAASLAPLVRRADHFVYLIDARKLCGPATRNETINEVKIVLRRFVECGAIAQHSRIDLVISKADLIEKATPKITVAEIEARIRNVVVPVVRAATVNISVSTTAARPHFSSGLPMCFGVDELLKTWIETTPGLLSRQVSISPISRNLRPFHAFALLAAPERFRVVESE